MRCDTRAHRLTSDAQFARLIFESNVILVHKYWFICYTIQATYVRLPSLCQFVVLYDFKTASFCIAFYLIFHHLNIRLSMPSQHSRAYKLLFGVRLGAMWRKYNGELRKLPTTKTLVLKMPSVFKPSLMNISGTPNCLCHFCFFVLVPNQNFSIQHVSENCIFFPIM